MSKSTTCLGCMQDKGQAEVCPFCGYREGETAVSPLHLTPGTILAGKYLIGRGLGHGGFGITYIARDQVLGIKLAIKEYLPQDCATRAAGSKLVTPFSGEGEKRFRDGMESFLQEARTLARFDGIPNIVGVRDFFTENGTAYLVMNYLEGITLKQYLVRSGGRPVPFEKMMGIMLPVMDALEIVHNAELLHRDISPDNIFLTTSGQVTLIDFGAARQNMSAQQSMSVILKPGYAPEEQYRSHGHQGPWTDIYALGATMYRTLTGKIPPEALERLSRDTLVSPGKLGIQMPDYAERALMRAMALHAEDRFRSISEFRSALMQQDGQGESAYVQRKPEPIRTKRRDRVDSAKEIPQDPVTYPLSHKGEKKKKGIRPAVVIVAILLLLVLTFVVLFFVYLSDLMKNGAAFSFTGKPTATAQVQQTEKETEKPKETPEPQEKPTPTTAPTPTPDPAMLPFIEGTVPDAPLGSFVPDARRIMEYYDNGERYSVLTGHAPYDRKDMLCAYFRYNREFGFPEGGLYGYVLNEDGLHCVEAEDWGSSTEETLLLPADCAVGTSYSGMLGSCSIKAVNYSGIQNDLELKDSIIVRCHSGYAFFEKDKGLVLIQSALDGGSVSFKLTADEPEHSGIYNDYVDE